MLKDKGILTDFQKAFLRLFANLPDQERFYLTGGTALAAYYLGHRLSYDLDLFSSEADLIVPFSYRVEQAVQNAGMQVTIVRLVLKRSFQKLAMEILAKNSPNS